VRVIAGTDRDEELVAYADRAPFPVRTPGVDDTIGNGIASGVANAGAFAGAAVLPGLVASMGIGDMVLIPAALALAWFRSFRQADVCQLTPS
jgi:hypothetical protein